jgi:arginine-tRNA-protein transferase
MSSSDDLGDKNSDFFLTPTHPCSYLDRADAQTIFMDPRRIITRETYQTLSDHGFRRSGSHLYRPQCASCSACVPIRVPTERFIASRSQRKILKRNSDLRIEVEEAQFTKRHYLLYERYINQRHSDGDMYPATEDQFQSFLLSTWSSSIFLSIYEDKRLISVAVTDQLPQGLSAIYTFFEPTEIRRSLGVLSVLKQIALCQSRDLPYLYLGYWIKDSEKMSYKTNYRPTQLFINDRWVGLN